MSGKRFEPQRVEARFRDRAVLVAADRGAGDWDVEESLAELQRLAETAGAEIVATVSQKLEKPNPRTFIGSGKAEEVARIARDREATLVVFDDDLTPSQQANLERIIGEVKVVDRTALILDIFAMHAHTREGKLQVELAQMEYLLPRLRGLWRHLERLGGGIGTRGPGETQLETDRRLARTRIAELKRELDVVARNRDLRRKSRERSPVVRVAIVGYTNAGKSTLLNALTEADVLTEDQLFATLDSTTRRLVLPEGRVVTLTDTVGFINKLPHGLVEAFKSTLDEVRDADALLHVIDASHAQMHAQIAAVEEVLGEIGAAAKPQIRVYNKIDEVPESTLRRLRSRHPSAAFTSALRGRGLDELRDRIAREAARQSTTMTLLVPYTRGELVRLAHEQAQVVREEHLGHGTRLVVRVPHGMESAFREFEADATSDATSDDTGRRPGQGS
jgi:GTP-binding protein HflX